MLFSRLSINLKLLVLSALPLLLLLLFLFHEGNNLYTIRKNSYQTKLIIELSLTLGNIAHQHALERGLTAGYLGGYGAKGKDKLLKQRKKSDQSVNKLTIFMDIHQSVLINISPNIDELVDLLKQKKLVRAKVDKLAHARNAFTYYSSVNKKVIDTIDLLTTFIEDDVLNTTNLLSIGDNTLHDGINSVVEMLWLKERTSQSRGALYSVYERGTATIDTYTRIYRYIKDYDDTLELLINNRIFHTKASLIELSKMPIFSQVSTIHNEFLNQSSQLYKIQGPLPEKWFVLATSHIDEINTIIYEQKSHIIHKSQHIFAQSQRYFIVGIIIMMAVMSALIFLSYYIALNISSRIHNINNLLTLSISNNDLTVKVDEHGNDEVTHIAKGINSYLSWIKDVVNKIEVISSEQEYLANHDPLTKLANRNLLFNQLALLADPLQRNERHHAILYIDLDFFKTINDKYGHAIGDKVLQKFAKRLLSNVRVTDTVARLGGDEFAIILKEITSEKAYLVSQKLLEDMKKPLLIDNLILNISISIGMTFFHNEESQDPKDLLKQADQALYKAKESGRQQYQCFDKTLQKANEENEENTGL
jgi:diguanylate cyclase (GGDEF)-like protein